MQDMSNNLRIKLAKQVQAYKDENQHLTDEYHRIAQQYKELHKKMRFDILLVFTEVGSMKLLVHTRFVW